MRTGWTIAAVMIWTLVAGVPVVSAADEPTLDAVVSAALDTSLSPGLAVAVVRPGGEVWSKQYGFADRELRRPVAAATRFYIASTSKALTALAALQLASRGELDLNAPLARALPGARFGPGVPGDSIRVRDLLAHTHGIDPMGPVSLRVAFIGDYTNPEILASLAAHGVSESGRAFRYSNLGYDLMGIVLAPAKTYGWKEVVEREVLVPAGMTMTTAYRSRVPDRELAQPYEIGPNGWERVRLVKQDSNMGPAGGHFSTARDLARLVVLELSQGRLEGRQRVSAAAVALSQTQQVAQDRTFGPYHRHGWGFGWDLGTYESDTLIHRFGGLTGYFSHVSFMPRHGIGVVVLTNGGAVGTRLANHVANAVYDHLLGRPDAAERATERLSQLEAETAAAQKTAAAERAQRSARDGSLPLARAAYAGSYVNPFLGTLQLTEQQGVLRARIGAAESAVEVYDAAKNQLRVELFGGGSVLEAIVPAGAAHPRELRMMGQSFVRK